MFYEREQMTTFVFTFEPCMICHDCGHNNTGQKIKKETMTIYGEELPYWRVRCKQCRKHFNAADLSCKRYLCESREDMR